jgi:phytoene dehydrogenase-like protein
LGKPGTPSARRVGIAAGREAFAARLLEAFPSEGRAIDGFMRLLRESRADMASFVLLKFLPGWLSSLLASTGLAQLLFRFFRRSDVTLEAALNTLTQNQELKAV